jgi:ketosteroid isomerase-like protein/quercetin dioxygenase-like cupin family protein
VLLLAGLAVGCGSPVNVAQERETLLKLDREWSASTKDLDKFLSYMAPDATSYPPGMPRVTGTEALRVAFTAMASAPGFSLAFEPASAEVAASGDVGYTTGAYQSTAGGVMEKGKYVSIWKKQPSGDWKVQHDIFNADGSAAAPTAHAMVAPGAITWVDPPPSLPPGAKMAVLAGDPTKPGPFVIRAQVPAGYKVAPHWHPTDENLTVLSGTIALGMGDGWDTAKMESVATGGLAVLPANMRHSFLARTAATFQIHGMGPFAVNYVNAADDPRNKN